MLTLFYAPETCALASHIALRDANAPFALKRIDFAREEQRDAAYLEINPKGRVPALVTPDGILTETPAILAFIAQSFPEAELAPLQDAHAFAKVQSLNSFICSTLHVAHAHRMRGYRWVDGTNAEAITAMQAKVPEAVSDAFRHIEQDLFQGPFVMGDSYSIADPYLFTVAQWMESDGVDPSLVPKIAAHRERMSKRPSVQGALAAEQQV